MNHDKVNAIARALARIDAIPIAGDDGEATMHTETVRRARSVMARVIDLDPGPQRPSVYRTPDGGIRAEWLIGSWRAEVYFISDGWILTKATDAETGNEDYGEFGGASDAVIASGLAYWLHGCRRGSVPC